LRETSWQPQRTGMSNILLLGGTGFVGRAVCDKLVERSGGSGGPVTVPSRQPQRAKAIQLLPTIQLHKADINDEATPARLVAGADARFQPVWVNNVAQAIVTALDQPDSIGHTFECVGPRVYTLAELVRMAGRWSGHERPVVALPAALGRLQAMLMEWLPGEPL